MPERAPRPKNPRIESERLTRDLNRTRIVFLRTELQTCFTFADMAEAEQGLGDSDHAARSLADAEKGYATLVRFMTDPKHAGHITREEHAELSAGRQRLRTRLDKLARK